MKARRKHRDAVRRTGGCPVTAVLVLLLLWGMAGTVGCGKKAPPVAPDQVQLVPVSDLRATVEKDRLTLHWHMPEQTPRGAVSVGQVWVYRSRLAAGKDGCRGCPPKFEKIAELAFSNGAARDMRFSESLKTGYRYAYQVIVVATDGTPGPASNRVEFVH